MVITRPTPAPASNINPGASGATIVQLGDVLAVSVAEDPSFNGYYEVRLGGYIILPAVGRIDAMGLRLKVVQANVIRALEETQLPHATVKVTELRNTRNGY
jgi:protein involved in polysaccharide export with SLBB domain